MSILNEKNELIVELAEGTCQICGNKREIYYFSDFSYGERLLRTEDGKYLAYLNCSDDTAFDEVEQILKNILVEKKISVSQLKEADYFNQVFGVSCDMVNGIKIDASKSKVACINCGSNQFKIVEKHPPEMAKRVLPRITHNAWNQLDDQMKRQLSLEEFNKRNPTSGVLGTIRIALSIFSKYITKTMIT